MEVKRDKRTHLTDDQVVQLRQDYARLCDTLQPGEPVLEVERYLADKYGVTTVTVGHITSGATRKSAGGPLKPRPGRYRNVVKRGFTAGIEVVIKDAAGRAVITYRVPEDHTVTTQPISIPVTEVEDVPLEVTGG